MAVCKPREDWLREQLKSLNEQTYDNIELLIYDDCPEFPLDEGIVKELITSFPYRLIRGEKNIGSNEAFERLTAEGQGKYFSYCDQDDVWHSEKVERAVEILESTGSPMVCGDMYIIDGDGNRTADSITEIRKRHIFYEGENLAGYLLIKNFVTGCTMIMRADVAKGSIPFAKTLIHDQWLAINAALVGRIEVIRQPLIDYRQHGGNQTGILTGITDKQTYYNERIAKYRERLAEMRERVYVGDAARKIDELTEFYDARNRYFKKANFRDMKTLWKYRSVSKEAVLAEIPMKVIPNSLFRWLIRQIKKGRI